MTRSNHTENLEEKLCTLYCTQCGAHTYYIFIGMCKKCQDYTMEATMVTVDIEGNKTGYTSSNADWDSL